MTDLDQHCTENVTDSERSDEVSTWAVSVCFWVSLMVAAVCYGAVALSPKYSTWSAVRNEHRRNGMQLASLEKKIDYLERVKNTLETDPEFVERLTNTAVPNETNSEHIAVSGNLLFGEADKEENDNAARNLAEVNDDRVGLIYSFASNERLRRSLLVFSACLTVFAFTFLNDAGTSLVNLAGRCVRAVVTWPAARYVSSDHRDVDDNTRG